MLFKEVYDLGIFDDQAEYDVFFINGLEDPSFVCRCVGFYLIMFASCELDSISCSDVSSCPGVFLRIVDK